MEKICLCLTWINHVQVTKAGGKKVTRDETYSELVYSDELLSRVLARARKAYGADSKQVEEVFKNFHNDVNFITKSRGDTERVLMLDGRKLCTYKIRPLRVAFTMEDGVSYIVRSNGKIERTSGSKVAKAAPFSPLPKPVEAVKGKPEPKKEPVKPVVKPDKAEDKKPPVVEDVKPDVKPEIVEDSPPWAGKLSSPLSRSEELACKAFNVDPLNLPDHKPSGFKVKLWRNIKNKVKSA